MAGYRVVRYIIITKPRYKVIGAVGIKLRYRATGQLGGGWVIRHAATHHDHHL